MSTHTRPLREDAQVANVPVSRLRAHPRNIRTDLGDLRELPTSIHYEGVLVNLMVERRGSGRDAWFQILHGHRRWAAAQLAGVSKVPCTIVPDHADHEAIFAMMAEDKKLAVSAPDRRRAVLALRNEFHFTWPQIAERLGCSPGTVRAWAGDALGDREPLQHGDTPPPKLTGSAYRQQTPAHRRPSIRPSAVYDLLTEWDAGVLDAQQLTARIREWLGDWAPAQAQAGADR